jgi:hypothetical protein
MANVFNFVDCQDSSRYELVEKTVVWVNDMLQLIGLLAKCLQICF